MDAERYLDRIADRFEIDPATGCWIWTGGQARDGYGKLSVGGRHERRHVRVHRWLYEQVVEPLSPDLHLHHLCQTPACINPDHLEPVPPGAHVLLGNSPAAQAARRTCCPKGHEYTPDNTYWYRGQRKCRRCFRRNPDNDAPFQPHSRYRTHCPQGHPYDEANTYLHPRGQRICRKCRADGARRKQQGGP